MGVGLLLLDFRLVLMSILGELVDIYHRGRRNSILFP